MRLVFLFAKESRQVAGSSARGFVKRRDGRALKALSCYQLSRLLPQRELSVDGWKFDTMGIRLLLLPVHIGSGYWQPPCL